MPGLTKKRGALSAAKRNTFVIKNWDPRIASSSYKIPVYFEFKE